MLKKLFRHIGNQGQTFRHGIHPEEYKDLTDQKKIERMPFVAEYLLPLSQHIGAPSTALVSKGQQVKRGEMIAAPNGHVSVALHAPVDGTVVDIGLYDHPNGDMLPAIRIKTDPFSPQLLTQPIPADYTQLKTDEFLSLVQQAGIVGMGGAAFPAHVKFSIPEGKTCRYLMLNGSECEPFLTCDHRVMVEYASELVDGIRILNHFIGSEKIFIGIEMNKPDAINVLQQEARQSGLPIEVIPLQVKYPQGSEKMMISAILGKEVPAGSFPLDIETLVSNVGTVVALSQFFRQGKPLIERVVTITGTGLSRPTNVLVPIGTSIREVVEYCGGITGNASRFLLGGPMMGMVQKTLEVPVVKGTSGLLVLTDDEVQSQPAFNCIKCGWCVDACPLFLDPARLGRMAKKGRWEDMEAHHVMDCFECGSCSYVCPSGIPLVQNFRVAKGMIRAKRKKKV